MTKIERLYSEAFEDGVNYAIEKMFGENKELTDREMDLVKNKKGRFVGILGTGGGGNVGYLLGRKMARDTIKKGGSDEDVKKQAMKGSLIGSAGTVALAAANGYAMMKHRNPGTPIEFNPAGLLFHAGRGIAGSVVGSKMNANEMIKRRKTLLDKDKD
jgi:hypothetical protein